MPTVLVNGDHSQYARTLVQGLKHTDYFKFIKTDATEKEADRLMAIDNAKFIINIPTDFLSKFIRGEQPKILITVDATDPMLASNATAAANVFANRVFVRDLQGTLSYLQPRAPPFKLELHAKYNPELITYYH
nr:ABC transporter permease [Hydrotalea flava]NIN15325.1 ABC transporter permease [Hydrotalea flava]NIO94394.1 ABC transporter permease [Hydrotalea flava]NIS93233.1 ABC transporter permease [Hydrotalea flava]